MASSIVEKYHSMEYGPAPEDASGVTKWLEERGREVRPLHRWRVDSCERARRLR